MQHGLRRHFVGGVSGILRRLKRGKQEWGRTGHAGVDEKGEIAAFQIHRVLDLELEIGDQIARNRGQTPISRFMKSGSVPYFLRRPVPGEQFKQLRPEGVVAPARVAVGEDKQRRGQAAHRPSEFLFKRSMIFPPASTSSTSSGILPTAWVAQDRHGSKARIATSM